MSSRHWWHGLSRAYVVRTPDGWLLVTARWRASEGWNVAPWASFPTRAQARAAQASLRDLVRQDERRRADAMRPTTRVLAKRAMRTWRAYLRTAEPPPGAQPGLRPGTWVIPTGEVFEYAAYVAEQLATPRQITLPLSSRSA